MAAQAEPLHPKKFPWTPAVYDDGIIYAVRALASGTANAGQQQTAWTYMMYLTNASEEFADLSFRPDDLGGERATAFAEGKRWVGLMLRKLFRAELTPKGSQVGTVEEDPVPSRRMRSARHLPAGAATRKKRAR